MTTDFQLSPDEPGAEASAQVDEPETRRRPGRPKKVPRKLPKNYVPQRDKGIKERADEPGVFDIRVSKGKDPLTGQYGEVMRTHRGNITSARSLQRKLKLQYEGSGGTAKENVTVGQLLDAWLAEQEERIGKPGQEGLELNTWDNYELNVRTVKALDRFADTEARSIETGQQVLVNCYRKLEKNGLSASRRVQVHKTLVMAWKFGIGMQWVVINAPQLVPANKRPEPPKKSRPTPTKQDVTRYVGEGSDHHPDIDILVASAALFGLRRQALLGLKWPDVDFDRQLVFTRRFVNKVRGRVEIVDYGKSRRTWDRPVPAKHLDVGLIPLLKTLQSRQQARAEASGTTWPETGWLFSADGMGLEVMRPDTTTEAMGRFTASAGPRATPHDFRRHRSSQLLADGVDPARAAAELDHQRVSYFIDTYVHNVVPDVPPEMAGIGEGYGLTVESKEDETPLRRRRNVGKAEGTTASSRQRKTTGERKKKSA